MPRIRWPLGTRRHTNNVIAVKETSPSARPAKEPPAKTSKTRRSDQGVASTPDDDDDEPTAKKRKHTPTTKEPKSKVLETEKAKVTTPTAKQTKAAIKAAAADLLDVSDVIQLHDDERVPVWDTCDTIRRKIRALLAKDGITQAAFLRAIVTAAYGEGSTKKIQSTSFNNFMKQKGPLAGNTNCVYHAAYVFFEKMRVKQGKKKTADREVMETVWPDGVDTKTQSGRKVYIGSVNTRLGMDKYGKVKVIH
ncbi:hypothetical protein OQA88_3436 [Cercophora sp. LCS_1]